MKNFHSKFLLLLIFYVFEIAVATNQKYKQNKIVIENSLKGTKDWWLPIPKDEYLIRGFTDKISYSPESSIVLKISFIHDFLRSSSFEIRIYRLGFYGGDGGRQIDIINNVDPKLAMNQPSCKLNSLYRTVDCANWRDSAKWVVPSSAVTGVYIALPAVQYQNGTKFYGNYIPFVVRQKTVGLGSDLLFKVADASWVAYNNFGGWNLYRGNGSLDFPSRAKRVSYNRPFNNRAPSAFGQYKNFIFGSEYSMIFWLEKYGYDVSYISCMDLEILHVNKKLVGSYKLLLSVGHDEYWSQGMMDAHLAAREGGVNGNEAFWRIRWGESVEKSVDNNNNDYIFSEKEGHRFLICAKETIDNNIVSFAANDWTGTFIDPRHRPAVHPHALTGQFFLVNGYRRDRMTVMYEDSRLRFWRNTTISNSIQPKLLINNNKLLPSPRHHRREVFTSEAGLLGYEWDIHVEDCRRPSGLFTLSNTRMSLTGFLSENYGSSYKGNGTVTHKLSLYRFVPSSVVDESSPFSVILAMRNILKDHNSNQTKSVAQTFDDSESIFQTHCEKFLNTENSLLALEDNNNNNKPYSTSLSSLVFGAGTVQWSWALSAWHDGDSMKESIDLQQATLNVLADMNSFPSPELLLSQKGKGNSKIELVYPVASSDRTPPRSKIFYPSQFKLNVLDKSFNVTKKSVLRIKGTAVDYGGGVIAAVEVSMNGGRTWHVATGKESWSYVHRFVGPKQNLWTNTSDCLQQKSDSDPIVANYRDKLVQRKLLYDDDFDYDFTKPSQLSVLIMSRAVDDSGWMERTNLAAGICNIQNRNVKKTMDSDGNTVLMSIQLQQ